MMDMRIPRRPNRRRTYGAVFTPAGRFAVAGVNTGPAGRRHHGTFRPTRALRAFTRRW